MRDSGNSRQIDPCLEQPPHLSVSPALFQKFQKLIYAETGIWLGSSKTALCVDASFAGFARWKLLRWKVTTNAFPIRISTRNAPG